MELTISDQNKEDKIKNEEWIREYKSRIADYEYKIIRWEQELGGRGESSIIRNNQVIITSYYNITIHTPCSQRLINTDIK